MQAEGGKDAYYQLKNNFRINWRKLIRAIVIAIYPVDGKRRPNG